MLHAVAQNDLIVFQDLIDDVIVAAPRRPKAVEFTDQWLAEPTRVAGDRSEDGLQRSVPYLLREPVEMTETLSRDLDLVHDATSDVVSERQPLALLSVPARPPQRPHELVVFEDVEALFKGLEVVRAQEDERGPSIAGYQNAIVLTLDPVGQLREMGFDFREWKRVTHPHPT
jgi:hypothetical protein